MLNDFYKRYRVRDWVGHMEQLARIRPLEATDGLERGNRLYDVSTGGGLQFVVNADRGFDISDFRFQGIPLNWRSPNGDVNSKYHGETAWSRSFPGGLFVTGGLSQFGAPNEDEGEQLPLHGDLSNLPAWNVKTESSWHGDDYKLQLSGEIRQTRLFGERLVLYRTYTTELGSNCLEIHDVVKNEGFQPAPHMMLYHFNLGFPMLSPATVLDVQTRRTEPRDAEAKKGLSAWRTFEKPEDTFSEQVFLHDVIPTEDGVDQVRLVNSDLRLAFQLDYEHAVLPYLYQWKTCEKGTYVVGLEPANCKGIGGRQDARTNGTLRFLEPGDETHYQLRISVQNLSTNRWHDK